MIITSLFLRVERPADSPAVLLLGISDTVEGIHTTEHHSAMRSDGLWVPVTAWNHQSATLGENSCGTSHAAGSDKVIETVTWLVTGH